MRTTTLSIDTRELDELVERVGEALGSEKMNIALKRTIRAVGGKIRTLTTQEIRKKYDIKKGRVSKAIKPPIYSLHGTLSCDVPIIDPRGTIANGPGQFKAVPEGPGAKIILGETARLPHKKGAGRIHFYIPSGKLQGHIFVRNEDNVKWIGKRRKGTGKKERWKTKTGRKKVNWETKETGVRKRVGTLSHGVGIGVSQMAMNRAAGNIEEQVIEFASNQLLFYQEQILKGKIKR